jgi:xylulokinase
MREHGEVAKTMRVVGGGTRNAEWMRILADMYGCPIEIPLHAETSTALGAAVIAGVAVGVHESFDIAKRIAAPTRRMEPREENAALYRHLRTRFGELYEAVKGMYR